MSGCPATPRNTVRQRDLTKALLGLALLALASLCHGWGAAHWKITRAALA